jgi:cyanophycin synthetase
MESARRERHQYSLTYGGRAEFMIQNALAATLACFVHGVSLEDIRVG